MVAPAISHIDTIPVAPGGGVAPNPVGALGESFRMASGSNVRSREGVPVRLEEEVGMFRTIHAMHPGPTTVPRLSARMENRKRAWSAVTHESSQVTGDASTTTHSSEQRRSARVALQHPRHTLMLDTEWPTQRVATAAHANLTMVAQPGLQGPRITVWYLSRPCGRRMGWRGRVVETSLASGWLVHFDELPSRGSERDREFWVSATEDEWEWGHREYSSLHGDQTLDPSAGTVQRVQRLVPSGSGRAWPDVFHACIRVLASLWSGAAAVGWVEATCGLEAGLSRLLDDEGLTGLVS